MKLYCAAVGGCHAVLSRNGRAHMLTDVYAPSTTFGFFLDKFQAGQTGLSVAPCTSATTLLPALDRFVIYGSRGLCEHVHQQEAVDCVAAALAQCGCEGEAAAEQAAAALVRLGKAKQLAAGHCGCLSQDVTASVTLLHWH
jgi:serine/threonine protein phosphatase PrpC